MIIIALVIGGWVVLELQFGLVYTASAFIISSIPPAMEAAKEASNCVAALLINLQDAAISIFSGELTR